MTNKPISAPVLPSTGYCGNFMYFKILHKCFLTTKRLRLRMYYPLRPKTQAAYPETYLLRAGTPGKY